jgi:hypothetical protein
MSAKNAAAPMDQSREAHHPARPHHSPKGGHLLRHSALPWVHGRGLEVAPAWSVV